MLQKLVDELRKVVAFKETTVPGDVVLIAADNPRLLVYALVQAIEPDPGRKDRWWNVHMHLLTVPPRETVWTLREPQFTGREIFTMGGEERFLQAVRIGASSEGDREQAGRKEASAAAKPFRRLK
ncbi:MAG: hypothetical protein RBR09_04875 [Desulfobulbaceae bacterium]|jgi:hypothetical protein|nr:hypothetical protein [Desulfobulbaceae bacterium]MDY0350569.1 hypothetical protein [Desulfobulbaceae bacterium]